MKAKIFTVSKEDGEVDLGPLLMIQNSIFNTYIAPFALVHPDKIFNDSNCISKESINNFIIGRGDIINIPQCFEGYHIFVRTDGKDQVFVGY